MIWILAALFIVVTLGFVAAALLAPEWVGISAKYDSDKSTKVSDQDSSTSK